MSTFEFEDGGAISSWDLRRGHRITGNGNYGWSRTDLEVALLRHIRVHGVEKTAALLRALTGTASSDDVPMYMFGRVIAYVARNISLRPHKVAIAKALAPPKSVRKSPDDRDYA